MRRADERYRLAVDLVGDAEDLVQAAETALERQMDPTMADIAETELRQALQLQDDVAALTGPAIERRERAIVTAAQEALRALQGDPTVCWSRRHRKFHSPAVKARLVAAMGSRVYMKIFPA